MTSTKPKLLDKKSLEALLDPPSIASPPPPVHMHMAKDTHPLHQRMEHNQTPDTYLRYQLTLRAEPIRQESRMHRFLCPSTKLLPVGAEYLLSALRKATRHCHGRTLLAHEPGLGGPLGLAMLVQEYLLRGLVQRILVLAPPDQLGYWAARLNAGLEPQQEFRTSTTMPDEGTPPERLLLSYDLFAQELPPHMAQEGHYQMIAVTDASGLHNRRSRPWRNLLSLSPTNLLLHNPLPFQEQPVELHGYLALLGVPELPPAARLKRDLGPPESPITPEVRQLLRPFLDAVVLRNTHPTTPIEWAPRQWKTQDIAVHPPIQRLRKQLLGWIKNNQPHHTEENTQTHTHQTLLRAVHAGPAACAEILQAMCDDPTLSTHHTELRTWCADAEKLAAQDPRLQALRSLVRESPNSRILIFCQHQRSAQSIQGILEAFDDRPVALSHKQTPEAPPNSASDPSAPAIMLATDHQINPDFGGPIDIIIQYDLPWDAARLDARAHWLLHQQGEHTRQIIFFATEESAESQLLKVLDFRLKLDEIHPEELPLIERFLDTPEGLSQTLWDLLDQNTANVMESLSKQLLDARKKYRRLLDLNQRLFLDDYAL